MSMSPRALRVNRAMHEKQNVCALTLPGEHVFLFDFKNFSSEKKAKNLSLESHDE